MSALPHFVERANNSRSVNRLAAKVASLLFFGLLAMWPQQVLARMECGQVTPSFQITQNPSNYSGPRTAGTIIGKGVITVTVTCTGSAPSSGYPQLIIIGADIRAPRASGMRGILLQLVAPSTYSFTNGCKLNWIQENIGYYSWNFDRTAASGSGPCTATGSIQVNFILDGNPVGAADGTTTSATNIWGNVYTRVSDWQNGSNASHSYTGVPDVQLASTIPVAVSLNTTCNVTTTAIAVTLPTIAAASLPANGATAGTTPFKINLSGCTYPATPGGPYNAYTYFSFTPGAAANLIANSASSPAANVNAQILTSTFTPIANGGSITTAITAAGSYSIQLYARYYATGLAGAGNYAGQVAFSIAYL